MGKRARIGSKNKSEFVDEAVKDFEYEIGQMGGTQDPVIMQLMQGMMQLKQESLQNPSGTCQNVLGSLDPKELGALATIAAGGGNPAYKFEAMTKTIFANQLKTCKEQHDRIKRLETGLLALTRLVVGSHFFNNGAVNWSSEDENCFAKVCQSVMIAKAKQG